MNRLAPALGRRDYASAMDLALVNARQALERATGPAADLYRQRLDTLERQVERLLTLPNSRQAAYMADSIQPALFQLNELPARSAFPIFAGTPFQIMVADPMPPDEWRALCWPTIVIDQVLTAFGEERRASTVKVLTELAARWDNYVDNSYSQLPWELALNSYVLKQRNYEPPGHQWIFIHPSIGVEVAGTRLDELQRIDVAVLEGLGWIKYNGDHSRYYGLSGVATFATNRNVAGGVYAHLWFPEAKIGYLRRSDPDRGRRQSFLVSVDLYDILSDVPKKIQLARESALGGKLIDLLK
jgi:hypothetical protein